GNEKHQSLTGNRNQYSVKIKVKKMKSETMEITIFHDQKKEDAYLHWLTRLDNRISKLSDAYNQFAQKVGLEPFDKNTFIALNGNPESWAIQKIDEAAGKCDVPLQNSYKEYY